MECRAQHAPPHRLGRARVVEAGPRPRGALDGAGQPAWSSEHRNDAPARVQAKLLKAFAEVTGLRAAPVHAEVLYWPDAQTTRPLGRNHLWDAAAGIGLAGDWCLGHRVEDAFVAGLELALAVA